MGMGWLMHLPLRYKKQRKRNAIPQTMRWEIYRRDGYKCVYCGGKLDLHLDHVVPYSRGGEDSYDNLVTACRNCNLSKGARTPREWLGGMT